MDALLMLLSCGSSGNRYRPKHGSFVERGHRKAVPEISETSPFCATIRSNTCFWQQVITADLIEYDCLGAIAWAFGLRYWRTRRVCRTGHRQNVVANLLPIRSKHGQKLRI